MNKPLDLIDQLQDIRTQLTDERKTLMARVALIDQALGMASGSKPTRAKPALDLGAKPGGIADAILTALAAKPGLTLGEIQAAIPDRKPKSIESLVSQLSTTGKLTHTGKPRRYSVGVG